MNQNVYPHLNRLRIEKFTWEYKNEISIDFFPGLNILGGEDQAMKTAILRLIRYSMGGPYKRLEEEILSNSNNVILEILAGDKSIKTIRSCKRTGAVIEIIDEDGPKKLKYTDLAGDYFMKKLSLPQLIKGRKELDVRVRLTLNDLARSFVIDRDISYYEILCEVPPEDRKQIMKIMLGISNLETAPLENEEKQKKAQIEGLKSEIEILQKSLHKMDVPEMEVIERLEQNNKFKRDKLVKKEIDLRRQIRKKTSRTKGSTYNKLRVDLLKKKETLKNIKAEMSALQYQKDHKMDLKKRLKAEQKRINRHLSSESVLSSFTFSICPRCLQEIGTEMKEREIHSKCMLCGRDLKKKELNTKAWEKSLRDMKQNLREIDELISLYEQREKELSSQVELLEKEIDRIESEIEEETQEYVSESIEEFGLISSERREIEKKFKELEIWKGQRLYAQKLEYTVLPQKKMELRELEKELRAIIERKESKIKRINTFIYHFSDFMRKVLPKSFKEANWNTEEYLPFVNGQKHTRAMTGFGLSTTVIAFHYALLAMKFKEPKVDTNHPGILIIDEPQQQKIPLSKHRKIMHLLGEFAEPYKDSIQIIVAATDIPSDMRDYVREFDI